MPEPTDGQYTIEIAKEACPESDFVVSDDQGNVIYVHEAENK